MIQRIFPFLTWFSDYNTSKLRADLISGITVALVLIPQSMAYAQLAGLPAYFGLYAAFLPPMVASLFGSSRQLATGPVAVVSLMTAATLEPLATAGSGPYVAYAIILALMVGLFQLALGVLRLGLVVNFLSHPVVNGFTNAAAIIIATSQLSKLFGVYVDKAEHHYETIIRVVQAAFHYTHWPTLAMGVMAFAIMWGLRRINPRIPNVLIAVVVAIVLSSVLGFNHDHKADISELPAKVQAQIEEFNKVTAHLVVLGEKRSGISAELAKAKEAFGEESLEVLHIIQENDRINFEINNEKELAHELREALRYYLFWGIPQKGGAYRFMARGEGAPPEGNDGRTWRIKVGNKVLDTASLLMTGGGAVVGDIPKGLPSLSIPKFDLAIMLHFLPFAAIISLLGFMEAISIAKAMAAKTGQRLDPNQELIGQGLANILGSVGKSYPVSGSFSRSAVNLQAGAFTGMSSVVTSLSVVITLLFFTPLLYSLPQAVLAAVIMMAVIGLVNVSGFIHAWRAQWYDGAISIISFLATLAFAPHLDKGIMVGVVLSLGVFLYKSMRPTVASLALHPDCSLRDAKHYGLRHCDHIAVIRFDGPLFFANSSFLEDQINERMRSMPKLRHILIVANGINDMDASGEEALALLVERVRSAGVMMSFSGVKENVLTVMRRTHLFEVIGEENIYSLQAVALDAIWDGAHRDSDEKDCPLRTVCPLPESLRDLDMGRLSRVLLVDDERDFVESLAHRLRMRDIEETAVAFGGREALSAVRDEKPEVMLLDLRMPEVDGFSVLEQVKKEHPQVEVIILTGKGSESDRERALKLGAFAYLEKPIDIEELTRTMEAAYAKVNAKAGAAA